MTRATIDRVLTATSTPGVWTAPSASTPGHHYWIIDGVCDCPAAQLDRACWHRTEALRLGGFGPPQTESEESKDMPKQEVQVRDADGTIVEWKDLSAVDWGDYGHDDIDPQFPFIKIVQPMSGMAKADVHAGQFWHSDTEEYTSHVDGVVLLKTNPRSMFIEGEDKPVCSSPDGIAPLEGSKLWSMGAVSLSKGAKPEPLPHTEPANCGSCFFGQWRGEKGKRTPPLCGESLMLLLDRNDGTAALGSDLVTFRVKGRSIKFYKRYYAAKCAPKRLPPFAYTLTMTTEGPISEPGKVGKWYELRIEATPLEVPDILAYKDIVDAQRMKFAASASAVHDDEPAPEEVASAAAWGDGSESYDISASATVAPSAEVTYATRGAAKAAGPAPLT